MPQEEFQDHATVRVQSHSVDPGSSIGYCGLVSGALTVVVLMWCWSMTHHYTANDPAAEWDLFFVTWGK